ncbi:unnamed protein product [Rotaria magnacalcarata]|uniref:Uncharacterized protein n=1 Tax=Rotaria magnacalcarata TaxID=392030 RepID=A0A816KI30_9BILA|nr:unnamed protein product [Rotaria magnacalcarata]CAF3933886.1 unnamed protein product [Rotaria magnacalcarata]
MNADSIYFATDEYIRAASDPQLSSPDSHLLTTLLSEEDQHEYNQLLHVQLTSDVLNIVNQLTSLFHISSSAVWMSMVLLKKLPVESNSFNLLAIIACVTLSCKYQDSPSQVIDYELIAQCYSIEDVRLIQNAEIELLEYFEYDICVATPDHFFSYLINLTADDVKSKHAIEQARSVFFMNFLSNERADLFYNYPSSIVTLSFIYNIASNKTFIMEQMKSFLVHKKDPSHYFKQLLLCTDLLQSCNVING